MISSRADILLHPVRLRIVMAMGLQRMTPRQIATALPDIPQASLYRHLGTLQRADILTVVEETPIRGTVERVYQVQQEAVNLSADELSQISREENLRYFSAFTAALISQFRAYLQQEQIDLKHDGVSYRSAPLYLTDEELKKMLESLRAVLLPLLDNAPSPDRRRRILSTILIPDPIPVNTQEETETL